MRLLLSGLDTVECAYYLRPARDCALDFGGIRAVRETAKASKRREPLVVNVGGKDFLLGWGGTGSGYPFVMSDAEQSIQFGEFNEPSFFVTYRSHALWHKGAAALHQQFNAWADGLRFHHGRPEGLSRVDFTFDFELPEVDFDADSFVTLASKDRQHRKDRRVQTFDFGEGDLKLRVYDKCAEINEASEKTWFHDLWGGVRANVWRVEFQVRKKLLRRFSLRTFEDLFDGSGDLLRYLVHEHTSLRVKTDDSNRSRWPLHPLWAKLQTHVDALPARGVLREVDEAALLKERLMRLAISVEGYLKRASAIYALKSGEPFTGYNETVQSFTALLKQVHDPLTWRPDVERRVTQMRLGQW